MGVLSVSMGHQSSGLLLPLPCPLGSHPRPLWGVGFGNLFGTFGFVCSMRVVYHEFPRRRSLVQFPEFV